MCSTSASIGTRCTAFSTQGRCPKSRAQARPSESVVSGVDSSILAEFLQAAEQSRPQLLWVARQMADCREDAEDILQDAFLKAFKNLQSFRCESRMTTWLNVIVRNTAREFRRNRRGKTILSLDGPSNQEGLPDEISLPDKSSSPE